MPASPADTVALRYYRDLLATALASRYRRRLTPLQLETRFGDKITWI